MPVKHIGLSESQRVGVVAFVPRAVSPSAKARRSGFSRLPFRVLDVKRDGNCGAYCLAALRLALTGLYRSNREIRRGLYAAAKKLGAERSTLRNYARMLKTRFLESFDLSLYCHMLKRNCAILVASDHNAFRWQVIGYKKKHPEWVFFLLENYEGRAAHYQLIARSSSRDDRLGLSFSTQQAQAFLGEFPEHDFDPLFAISVAGAIDDYVTL